MCTPMVVNSSIFTQINWFTTKPRPNLVNPLN